MQCWDGELPELATAAQYKAIFITGSHYSAYEDLPWIDRLVAWLHDFVIGAQHDTKIVAVCFGSQVGHTAVSQPVIGLFVVRWIKKNTGVQG